MNWASSFLFESPVPPEELFDEDSFLRAQGVRPDRVDPEIYLKGRPYFWEARQEAASLIHPRAVVTFRPVREIREGRVSLKGGGAVDSPLIATLLRSAEEIVAAVSTLGEDLERRVSELFHNGDPARGFALDGWGTSALVSFGRILYGRLQELAGAKGRRLSISFSPGHAEWPLENQVFLFGLLPAERVGVRLMDSFIMVPKKSASMIAGLGGEVVSQGTNCDYCPRKKDCLFRRN